jgi:hypothetical protein
LQIFAPYQGDATDDGWRGLWVLGERSAAALQRSLDEKLSSWMRATGDAWSNNWH